MISVTPVRFWASIGAVIDIAGRNAVPRPMAREKDDLHVADAPLQQRVGRRPPRRFNLDAARILKSVDLVNAGAADDPEFSRRRHDGGLL